MICRRITVLLVASCAVLSLAGCGWLARSSDFDQVPEGERLEVPPDLDAPDQTRALRVPGATYSKNDGAVVSDRPSSAVNDRTASGSGVVALEGGLALVVDQPVRDVYDRVGVALERIGMKVLESNAEGASYRVEYVDTEARAQRPNIFARWILRRKGPTDMSGTYLIKLTERGSQTAISLDRADGATMTERVADDILSALEERLI